MSETLPSSAGVREQWAGLSVEERHGALFAQLVMQQANLALMLLGRTPHPDTGQTVRDLDAARMFIDQLEMIEARTQGNLKPPEAALLKQSLMTLRLAFVEEANKPESPSSSPAPTAPTADSPTTAGAGAAPPGESEPQKRFTKKY